jgi:HPt (histidine-containing phosphotransfer) domain-containing protein
MIDWSQVAELRAEVGEDDFPEVVALFIEEVEEVLARLRGAESHGDLTADLHFLKGSALSLGFAEFSQLCRAGEAAAAQGRGGDIALGEILAVFEVSRHQFLDQLATRFG